MQTGDLAHAQSNKGPEQGGEKKKKKKKTIKPQKAQSSREVYSAF